MLKPSRWLGRATDRLFRHIEVDEEWRRAVEAVAARGPVVYVLRTVSVVDFLALVHVTERFGLPRVGFVNELPAALRPPTPRGARSPAEALRATVAAGGSAALFVKRPPERMSLTHRGRSEGAALLEELVALQRAEPAREIMLVPQIFVWSQRPERLGYSVTDFLFGPVDVPGELRSAAQFLLNYKNGRLRAGEPLSLRELLAQQGPAERTQAVVRRLTYALLRKVERERRSIVGPARKAPDRVREEVLRSPRLQAVLEELGGPRGEELAVLTDNARRMLRQLQTTPDPQMQRSLELVADRLVDRVYSGIDVDREGIERLREAVGRGAVVLLPSHKSHVDYIVLSYTLRKHAIQTPVIAAGDNLSFFPLGPVLRRAGAFFIRRSFRGDRVYTAVVDAYVRRLLREGHIIELFLEGGRSRTGKLLPPQLGLLNMVVQACLQLEGRPTFFVPVSIGYERLMEEDAFERELSGEQKRPEDLTALLKIGGVLVQRWGRVNIQIGAPIELASLGGELGLAPPARSGGTPKHAWAEGELSPARRRALIKRLAHQAMSEINRVTALTPGSLVATVLLSEGRRGIGYPELVAHCARLVRALLGQGARATPSLVTAGGVLRERGVQEAVGLYVRGGLVERHVPGERFGAANRSGHAAVGSSDAFFTVPDRMRLRLDLAKNHIVHWLVDRALIAVALVARGEPEQAGDGTPLEALRERVHELSRLFKYEFMFRTDAPFGLIFDETLAAMTRDGLLALGNGCVRSGGGADGLDGRGWLDFYAAVLRNFVEGYRVAARASAALVRGALSRKDVLARALRLGERMLLRGEITRAEAVCKPVIDNALASFCDQGYLVRTGETLGLAESFQSESAAAILESRIAAYLGRPAGEG